jgi:hypothetical protein
VCNVAALLAIRDGWSVLLDEYRTRVCTALAGKTSNKLLVWPIPLSSRLVTCQDPRDTNRTLLKKLSLQPLHRTSFIPWSVSDRNATRSSGVRQNMLYAEGHGKRQRTIATSINPTWVRDMPKSVQNTKYRSRNFDLAIVVQAIQGVIAQSEVTFTQLLCFCYWHKNVVKYRTRQNVVGFLSSFLYTMYQRFVAHILPRAVPRIGR